MGDIYCKGTNISVLAEWYRCPKGSVLLTFQASSTKRWRGYECLAQVHICIVILIIRLSSGCYCVSFSKSGYKMFILKVPGARLSLLKILTEPLEPIASPLFFQNLFLVLFQDTVMWNEDIYIYNIIYYRITNTQAISLHLSLCYSRGKEFVKHYINKVYLLLVRYC